MTRGRDLDPLASSPIGRFSWIAAFRHRSERVRDETTKANPAIGSPRAWPDRPTV